MNVGLSVSVIQRGKSGVASYVFGLLDGFAELGWPVRFHLFGLADDRPLFERWLGPCAWEPVAERWRPAVANIFWHQTALKSRLRRAGADLLHIPSYRRIVAGPPCPQVVTIHDCAPFRFPGKYDALRMLYGRRVVVPLARRADRVIAVSETTAADLGHFFGLPRADVAVTFNGIDHRRFQPAQAAERLRDLRRPDGLQPGWWVYVARLEHPGKNHLRLLEAFEMLCDRLGHAAGQLVLAGADWHGSEVIHRAAAASRHAARIFLPGFVALDDLPAWYAGARALVFPSLFEGFGIPLVEAMACGTPVLCPAEGAMGEVAAGASLSFDPRDPASIAAAMERLATDPAVAPGLVEKGLGRAADFHWRTTAMRTLEVYRQVCHDGGGAEASA
jgi:glycosyltransferase involved in cell wall biosynthesis